MHKIRQLFFIAAAALVPGQSALAQDADFRLGLGIPLGSFQTRAGEPQFFARANGASATATSSSIVSSPGQSLIQDYDSSSSAPVAGHSGNNPGRSKK